MTEHAVALVLRPGEPVARAADPAVARASARHASGSRRARRLGPGHPYVLALLGVLLAVWLVLVFGRALSELNEASERVATIRAESAALEARLDAGRREVELVQGDAFMAMQARAYGMGRAGERPFALDPAAPPAPVITPLGAQQLPPAATTPLDAWLRLLFGGG